VKRNHTVLMNELLTKTVENKAVNFLYTTWGNLQMQGFLNLLLNLIRVLGVL